MKNFYIRSKESVTVYIEGVSHAVTSDHAQYQTLLTRLAEDDWEGVTTIVTAKDKILALVGEFGEVAVYGGHVTFKGEPLHNYLVEQIINATDVAPLAMFLDNVMQNPSMRATQDLYRWCEAGKLPITTDGQILAYKYIRDDYKDAYSGTFDNSPGQIVEMPRNKVNEDPEVTCSYGLHFCSQSYLGNLSGKRLVLVKIHPRDVVAFPTDYGLSKGRCCRYEVVVEIDKAARFEDHVGFYKAAERIKVGERLVRNSSGNTVIKTGEVVEVAAIDYDGTTNVVGLAGRKGTVRVVSEVQYIAEFNYPISYFDRYIEVVAEPAPVVEGRVYIRDNTDDYVNFNSTEGYDYEYIPYVKDARSYTPAEAIAFIEAYSGGYAPLRTESVSEALFYVLDESDDYVVDPDGSYQGTPPAGITRAEAETLVEEYYGAYRPLTIVPVTVGGGSTFIERIQRIEEQLRLDGDGLTVDERLGAIDEALGLDADIEPMILRVDRAERQLGLS